MYARLWKLRGGMRFETDESGGFSGIAAPVEQHQKGDWLSLIHIFPVINKVDLPSARPDEIAKEIEDVLGLDASDAPRISAKSGENVEQVLQAIVEKLPPPSGEGEKPLKALVFDSFYDNYKGCLLYTSRCV